MSIMTFTLSFNSAINDDSEVSSNIVNVVATSLKDAEDCYAKQSKLSKIKLVDVVDVTTTDYRIFKNTPNNTFISDKASKEVFIRPLEPFPARSNMFRHDLYHMGTNLVRGWSAMHQGFDNKDEEKPLEYLILINERTGQRWEVYLRDEYNDMYNPDAPIFDILSLRNRIADKTGLHVITVENLLHGGGHIFNDKEFAILDDFDYNQDATSYNENKLFWDNVGISETEFNYILLLAE